MAVHNEKIIITVSENGSRTVSRNLTDLGTVAQATNNRMAYWIDVLTENMNLLTTIAVGAGVALSAVGFGFFEKEMNSVKVASQATAEQMDLMNATARRVGLEYGSMAIEVAAGMTELSKAGVSAEAITKGAAEGAVILSKAVGAELADGAGVAANAMLVYGIEAERMMDVVQQGAAVINLTTHDLNDYRLAIANAGLVAKSVGLSFEDFNATLAATASGFSSGATQGTTLKTFLMRLSPSSKEAARFMKDVGLEVREATGELKSMDKIADELVRVFGSMGAAAKSEMIQQIFGTDAYQLVVNLMNAGGDTIRKFRDEIIPTTDAVAMAKVRTEGLAGALNNLIARLVEFSIRAMEGGWGQAIAAMLNGIGDGLLWLADTLETFEPLVMGVLAAVAANTIAWLFKLTHGFAFLAVPIKHVFGLILKNPLATFGGALVGVGFLLHRFRDQIFLTRDGFVTLGDFGAASLDYLGEVAGKVANFFATKWNDSIDYVNGKWQEQSDTIQNGWLDLLDALRPFANRVIAIFLGMGELIRATFQMTGPVVQRTWSDLVLGLAGMFSDFMDMIIGWGNSIVGFFKGIADSVVGFFKGIFDWIGGAIATFSGQTQAVVEDIVIKVPEIAPESRRFLQDFLDNTQLARDRADDLANHRSAQSRSNMKGIMNTDYIGAVLDPILEDAYEKANKRVLAEIEAGAALNKVTAPQLPPSDPGNGPGDPISDRTQILNELNRSMEQSIKLSEMDADTRQVMQRIMQVNNELDDQKLGKLTKEELPAVMEQLYLMVEYEKRSAIREGILNNHIGLIREHARVQSILNGMLEEGTISQSQYDMEMGRTPLQSALGSVDSQLGGTFEQDSQMSAIALQEAERLSIVKQALDAGLIQLQSAKDREIAIHQATALAIKNIEFERTSSMLQDSGSVFDSLTGMAKDWAGEQSDIYKAMFAVSKAFAIADSIVKIQQGLANAAALPFPMNLGAMASVAAAAASIISNIRSVQMLADGGQVFGPGGPRGDQIPALLSDGEFVMNAASTAQFLPLLQMMNANRFANGGQVGRAAQSMMAAGGGGNMTFQFGDLILEGRRDRDTEPAEYARQLEQKLDQKMAIWARQQKRSGGMLNG